MIAVALVVVAAAGALAYVGWWRAGGGVLRIFVSNYRDNTLSVIDGELGREVKVLPVGDSPMGIAVRRDPPLVAVANSTADRVTLVDPLAPAIIGSVRVAKGTEAVAFSPDGALLYVAGPFEKTLQVVDVARRAVIGAAVAFDRRPTRLAVSPDGRRVYVMLRDERGAVAVVDAGSRRIETTIPIGRAPCGLALGDGGRRLLAASFDDSAVTVIDTTSLAVVATHAVNTGSGLVAHPSRPLVYSMASGDDEVDVLDFATGQVVATITGVGSPTNGAITGDGETLYVPYEDADMVAAFATVSNARLERIAVGNEPVAAAIFDTR